VSYGDAVTALRLGGRSRIHHIADFRLHELLVAAGGGPSPVSGRTARRPARTAGLAVLRSTVLGWCDNGFQLVDAAKTCTSTGSARIECITASVTYRSAATYRAGGNADHEYLVIASRR
jgi:hypothetical protein